MAPRPLTQQLSNCPALLPDQVEERQTFLDSIVLGDQFLASSPTTEEFLFRMIEAIGRPGPKSRRYYQNVLDAFFVVGLIERTSYARDREAVLHSTLPTTYVMSELRDFCIQQSKDRLRFGQQFLDTVLRHQPCSRQEVQDALGITLDNSKRHMRLFVNLDAISRGADGYRLTYTGMQHVSESKVTQPRVEQEPMVVREVKGYSDYDEASGLADLAFLSGESDEA